MHAKHQVIFVDFVARGGGIEMATPGENTVVYQIVVPADMEDERFRALMVEQVFPAILPSNWDTPSRLGDARRMRLLRGIASGRQTQNYLWIIESGYTVIGRYAQEILEKAGLGLTPVAADVYVEVASWDGQTTPSTAVDG